jgi:hypothetical protein
VVVVLEVPWLRTRTGAGMDEVKRRRQPQPSLASLFLHPDSLLTHTMVRPRLAYAVHSADTLPPGLLTLGVLQRFKTCIRHLLQPLVQDLPRPRRSAPRIRSRHERGKEGARREGQGYRAQEGTV